MERLVYVLALALPFLAACETSEHARAGDARTAAHDGDGEVDVPLSKVPAAVQDAARKAVPGIVLSGAERDVEDGVVVYDVEGTANGKEYEIEVTEAGEIIAVEEEEEDEDDDDDHEDDHDD